MSPLVIQVALTIPFSLAIGRTLSAMRASQISWRRSLFWVCVWIAGLVAVWFPDLTNRLAHLIGVGRGVDAVLYLSIALLSYLVFRLYIAVERQDQLITRLVSALALQMSPSSRENP